MGPSIASTLTIAAVLLLPKISAASVNHLSSHDVCSALSSCSECLSKTYCSWCVTKNKCTKQFCGNDNIIYPKNINALMSGIEFCPRIVEPENEQVFESGKKHIIAVKITQIYLYMAFTQWKCKISLNGKDQVVNAVLFADEVYCDSAELNSDTGGPYADGNIEVFWENSKKFDGIFPFKVCKCALNPTCTACTDSKST